MLRARLARAARWLGRLLYRGLLLYCWLLLVLYLGFKFAERQSAIASLPAGLEPAGVVAITGQGGFREGCGVAVFRLAWQTRARLRDEGAAFLGELRQARGSADRYYRYGPWQSTPVPASWTSEGGWLPLWCAEAGESLVRRVQMAIQEEGGYYSEKDEGALLILPKEGLIVFAYNG